MIPVFEDTATIEYDPSENIVTRDEAELLAVIRALEPGKSMMITAGRSQITNEYHCRRVGD